VLVGHWDRVAALKPLRLLALLGLGACVAERGLLPNRMAHAATSYLSRAARHPVGWQPWGRDAFELAGRLNRPVLLYVGADDCEWCALMDTAVYDDPALAALINSRFVPVRVDRDERPDVALRYQSAVQTLSGLRGYPLTVFLTPDGSPFFGGTYFPADDPITGRGLFQVLPEVARSFRDQRAAVTRQAALVRQLANTKSGSTHGVLAPEEVQAEIGRLRDEVARASRAPEKPRSVAFTRAVTVLLTEYGLSGDTAALATGEAALARFADTGAAHMPDDPPAVVQAGALRALAQGWALTNDTSYRSAGRAIARGLAAGLSPASRQAIFADQQSFIIGSVLETAATLDDTSSERLALAALDSLLHRTYARGWGVRHAMVGSVQGLLQDQVQVASACLAAFDATGDTRYRDVAVDIAMVLERDFADPAGGYFDASRPDPAAPAMADRTKEVWDEVLPGANAWAARVLIMLAGATGELRYRRRGEATLEAFAGGFSGAGMRAATYLETARGAFARR
jgi:uncharacterized protein YyaL (SSP411 family)